MGLLPPAIAGDRAYLQGEYLMMKLTLKCLAVAGVLSALAPLAAANAEDQKSDSLIPGTFSGNIAFTTDYRFRGITQTQGDPAIQGGITYTHPTGFYAGIWASNLKFTDGDKADMELDTFFGFSNTIGKFSYDVGGIFYAYPGAHATVAGYAKNNDYNYWEIYFTPSYDFGVASVSGSIYYSPNFFGDSGDAMYYKGAVAVPLPFLPFGATIDTWGGYQEFLDLKGADYWDWSVGLGFTVEGFGLDFRYTDTNLGAPLNTSDVAGPRFVFTLSRSF